MWDALRAFRRRTPEVRFSWERLLDSQIVEIDATELSSLTAHFPKKLMIFDLRDSREVNKFPFIIPDALLAANANLFASVPWILPEAIIVLYSEAQTLRDDPLLDLIASQSSVFVLKGGLQAWLEARLPVEQLSQRDLLATQNNAARLA